MVNRGDRRAFINYCLAVRLGFCDHPMQTMPRIAIPVPTLNDVAYNQRSFDNYANAVREAGGEPVMAALDLDRAALRSLAESCHGICLTGSPADIEPGKYGAEREEGCSPADPAREALDFFLLDHAEAAGKPLLGICFGMQSMNVWRGGTLVQDLMPVPVNHSAGAAVLVAHSAVISSTSLLGSLVDRSEATADANGLLRLPINSSHHQAAASPGDGLRIVARSPEDGVIEAIEADPDFPALGSSETARSRFLLGLQWHPERTTATSATSRNIFRRLVEEALVWEHRG